MVSSIRSRQTGHVGSSIRLGVGGGKGFSEFEDVVVAEGVKGSWLRSGKLPFGGVGVSKVMERMKATWHVSGCSRISRLVLDNATKSSLSGNVFLTSI